MFFGLCNSSATFQKMIDTLFLVPLIEGWILVYMNDILIFTSKKELLKKYTCKILQILANNNLYLNLEKCEFEKEEIEYLGFIISSGQIKIDLKKVYGISCWSKPKTVHQVCLFLGFGNFYCCFIHYYSELAWPLINLTKKNQLFSWRLSKQNTFDTLKSRFTSLPVLTMPDSSRSFLLETDISKFATGAVLMQKNKSGKTHLISFLSQSLFETECHYQVYDWELLAIICALEEYWHYLQGFLFTTTIFCDYQNLTYYWTPQKLTPR